MCALPILSLFLGANNPLMPLSGTRAEQRLNAASVHSVGKGGGAQGQSPPAPLAGTGATTHMRFMPNGLKSRSHISEPLRLCLQGLGAALVAVSPAVGVIPGPGGIIVFSIGFRSDESSSGKECVSHVRDR